MCSLPSLKIFVFLKYKLTSSSYRHLYSRHFLPTFKGVGYHYIPLKEFPPHKKDQPCYPPKGKYFSVRSNCGSWASPIKFSQASLPKPKNDSPEWIRILKQNFQVMSQARLQSFAETFGILPLVEEFKARFQIARSA